jgi:hypothetical protein
LSYSPQLLRRVPSSLEGLWIAIAPPATGQSNDRDTPLRVALASGDVVVDADDQLDVLCARLKAEKLTSLTIVYNGKRHIR